MKIFYCESSKCVEGLKFLNPGRHKFVVLDMDGSTMLVVGPEEPGHPSIVHNFLTHMSISEVKVCGGGCIKMKRKKVEVVLSKTSIAYGSVHPDMIKAVESVFKEALSTYVIINKLDASDARDPKVVTS